MIHVVDDDASVRKALKRLLIASGFEVQTHESAESLLAQLPENGLADDETGCLLLDVHLPGMNGLELQEVLSARRGRYPIIFITAYDEPLARARAMRAGAVEFLKKPLDSKSLLSALGRATADN